MREEQSLQIYFQTPLGVFNPLPQREWRIPQLKFRKYPPVEVYFTRCSLKFVAEAQTRFYHVIIHFCLSKLTDQCSSLCYSWQCLYEQSFHRQSRYSSAAAIQPFSVPTYATLPAVLLLLLILPLYSIRISSDCVSNNNFEGMYFFGHRIEFRQTPFRQTVAIVYCSILQFTIVA